MKDGALRTILEDARREEHCSRADLTVLSPQVDPYRLDTPSYHRDGAWLAAQLNRLFGPERTTHWRGLHYAIVACGDVLKPNGEIYKNTEEDWIWLSIVAGKAARWLGYIDFDRITDNRNADPVIHRKACIVSDVYVKAGVAVEIPDVNEFGPYPEVFGFDGRQPYALAIFGEKTSLESVLLPIAERFDADLYLPSGEISDAQLHRMAKDAAADGRPLILFVLADFDPSGHQMSVSMGRKLQALRDLLFPDIEFEVVRVGLTAEQVRDLELPSTPLKETELRANRWREAFGVEQTEIDALATLRPDDLERIVVEAIDPFYDASLAGRVQRAEVAWRHDAQQALDAAVDGEALAAVRERASTVLSWLGDEVEQINKDLRELVGHEVELPSAVIPGPSVGERPLTLASIVSSAWSWAKATKALIAHKAYEDTERR